MKTYWPSDELVYTSLYPHLEPDVKFFAGTNTWAGKSLLDRHFCRTLGEYALQFGPDSCKREENPE